MNEVSTKEITVDDFNVICRVCLEIGENMTDIFKSGMENQLMEITNLKVEVNDKLPRTLCQKCCNQIYQHCVFLQLAESSDIFLRSLLPSVIDSSEVKTKGSGDNLHKEKKFFKRKRKKARRESDETKNYKESDNLYLIIVPDGIETEMDSKVYIKDLNLENDNLELSNYCRALLKTHSSNPKYNKEQISPSDGIFRPNYSPELGNEKNKTHTVNLHVYKCGECKAAFEEHNELTDHFSIHEVEPSFSKSNFNCPICDFSEVEKSVFTNHLRAHKEDGFCLVKVNTEGEIMSLKENEKDLFVDSFPDITEDSRIFRLCLSSLHCAICSQNIQSVESIADHLESSLCRVKSVIKFHIEYRCPICCKIFIDEEKNFIKHLSCHKEENYYFIKVDNKGELAQVTDNEKLFVPFEEATKIFSVKNRLFEIINVNSCDKCDFSSEFFKNLCEHSRDVHFEETLNEVLFSCPVCQVEFKGVNVDEKQSMYYEHLKLHKNEGVSFVLVNKNKRLSHLNQKHSDIFTQSQFLWFLLNSSVAFQNILPELVILDIKNPSGKYSCDFCQKQFKTKSKVIVHLKSHQMEERSLQESVIYICEKCGKRFSRKAYYKKHFLKHLRALSSVSKRPVCTICDKKFANRATYDSHIRHHLKEASGNDVHASLPGIICEKCGRSFSNNASLTKHKRMHLKEKENALFKCEICHRDFFRQASFDRHRSAHMNPRYYECGTCKLPLRTITSLQKHSEIHKNGSKTFDCKDCQLSFLTKDSLTAHQSHTGHYVDKKPLECNVCHEKFFIGKKFSAHIKTHPKYKVGECTLCGKWLSTLDSLMKHRRKHFESNTVLCPHCGKRFFEDKNYERHLLVHEGKKAFPCDLEGCDKAFYTRYELKRHKKYHNNVRDFKCSYCPKSFNEASHLTTHVRTHTGERPYKCPHCNKGFQTRSHCKNHIKLIHQGVGYDLIRTNISKKVTLFESVGGMD